MPKHVKADRLTAPNRLAGGGIARLGDDFTDRVTERATLARSLKTPRGHVVLSGRRRIGKSSLLVAVQEDLRGEAHPVVYVDLWSASTLEDMTTRLAAEAAKALGTRWAEAAITFAQRLKFKLELSESAGGLLLPMPTVELRDASKAIQRQRLVDAFNALEALAKSKKAHLGVIIDEFQEIERLGSEGKGQNEVSAMRQVRAAIQQHSHVTYIFAGSDRRIIEKLTAEQGGALHNMGRRIELGPIPNELLAPWIDTEMRAMGLAPEAGVSARIIAVAGDRTRDVRTLAESCAELARQKGVVNEATISAAMETIVNERRSIYDMQWKTLNLLSQNALRATAAEGIRLTTAAVMKHYSLKSTSRAVRALQQLDTDGILVKDGDRYRFDDPFFRAWVIKTALQDVGVHLPITHVGAVVIRRRTDDRA